MTRYETFWCLDVWHRAVCLCDMNEWYHCCLFCDVYSLLPSPRHVLYENLFVRSSNYIPQILWDVITFPCPWYLLLAHSAWCYTMVRHFSTHATTCFGPRYDTFRDCGCLHQFDFVHIPPPRPYVQVVSIELKLGDDIKYNVFFLHAKPWIPGGEISIFTAVIH